MSKTMPAKNSNTESPKVARNYSPHIVAYGLCALVIIILSLALGFSFYKMQAVLASNQSIKQSYDSAGKAIEALGLQMQQQQKDLSQVQRVLAVAEASKQEVKEKWQVVEAEYLINMANYALYFNQNHKLAMMLLKQAYSELIHFDSAAVLDVKKAIKSDMDALSKIKTVNVSEIYLTLHTLSEGLYQLPLIGSESSQKDKAVVQPPEDITNTSHWQAFFSKSISQIKRLIVVRHDDNAVIPAILVEQQDMYYQYLQLCLAQTKWAILHRDAKVFHTSLQSAKQWVQRYFIQTDSHTKAVLASLEKLQGEEWSERLPGLSHSMQAIANLNAARGEMTNG